MNKTKIVVAVKKTLLWRCIVPSLRSLVEIIWRLTYGLKPSLMYILSVRPTKDNELRKKGVKIFHSDSHFTDFAQRLASQIPEDLIFSEIEKLKSSDDEQNFMTDISKELDIETRLEILKFALDEKNIDVICGYLRFVPRVATIKVLLNRQTDRVALGPQRWHRDWFGYKGINIFCALTDIDEQTGMHSAIGLDSISKYSEIPTYSNNSSVTPYDRDRVSNESMLDFIPKVAINELKGPPGTTALVDTSWAYHKGGHIERGYRLLLEIAYMSEQKPKTSVYPNILEDLGLVSTEKLKNIVNTRVHRYMVSGGGKYEGGAILHWLSRKLTFYKSVKVKS